MHYKISYGPERLFLVVAGTPTPDRAAVVAITDTPANNKNR